MKADDEVEGSLAQWVVGLAKLFELNARGEVGMRRAQLEGESRRQA